jgi:TonB-like protein
MGLVIRFPALAAALVMAAGPAGIRAREARTPASLFIAIHGTSDVPSGWHEDVLDLSQVGSDVRVRLVRISLANLYCSNVLVRAVEQVLPHTTVGHVAGPPACAIAPGDVGRAIVKAKPASAETVFEAETQTVVARCGAEQRVFQFPWEQSVDHAKLRRAAPEVDALWRTYARLRERFGPNFHFDFTSTSQQKASEALGDRALPELMSGKYQAAYADWPCSDQPGKDCRGNYLAWYLRDYHGAPASRDLLPPELVEAGKLKFLKYTPPTYPQIALTAHMTGDVRLRLTVDRQTGIVAGTEVLSGNDPLAQSAARAAASWQLEPGSASSSTIDVTLRFQPRCAG